jgi:ABC-type transport system involved in cytochrome c biogenesis permease component
MYAFAVVILLGLALFKLVDVLEDLVPAITRYHSLFSCILAVAGAFALDYSVVESWKTSFREDWMGTAVTGLMVFGATSIWRAVFHYLGSSEGDAPEVRHPLSGPRSMAA